MSRLKLLKHMPTYIDVVAWRVYPQLMVCLKPLKNISTYIDVVAWRVYSTFGPAL